MAPRSRVRSVTETIEKDSNLVTNLPSAPIHTLPTMVDTISMLCWSLAASCLLSLLLVWLLQGAAIAKLVRCGRPAPRAALPPVSILKPIKGVDAELRRNIEAILSQDYPDFEVIIGVAHADDPALPLIREVLATHPAAPARLVIGGSSRGINPKVNNLVHILEHARYDLLLISDGDARPGPDYLETIVSELGEDVGLVHNFLYGAGEQRLGSVLEALHMNSFLSAALAGADIVGHCCVVGKSMLFRKKHLEAFGGFAVVEDVLAEDYVLGQRFQRAGYAVKLSSYALPIVNPGRDLATFFNRQLRWAQMRRRVSLAAYLAEPFGNPIAWVLALYVVVLALGHSPSQFDVLTWNGFDLSLNAFALAIISGKCTGDLILSRVLRGNLSACRHVLWIPIKDVLVSLTWLVGLFKRRVTWRGNVMWIGAGTTLHSSRRAAQSWGPPARA